VTKSRKTTSVFLHWLALRVAVNSVQLAGLDEALGRRLERWTARSYDLERDWRGK
jgi:hypothetical protein